jgi:hypothetical protein
MADRHRRSRALPSPVAVARGAGEQAWLTLARRFDSHPWMQRRLADHALRVAARWVEPATDPVAALHAAEASRWSQHGEDGLLAALLADVGEGDRTFVEIGCADGEENCTRALAEDGWRGVWFDGDEDLIADARRVAARLDVGVHQAFVTSENVGALLREAGVPHQPGVAVLDIDGSDLWVLRAMLEAIAPRVLVVEYNATFPPGMFWTRRNRSSYSWPETYEHGASLDAMYWAARAAGYALVACDRSGVNAFFVRDDVARAAGIATFAPEAVYRPLVIRPPIVGHPWWTPEPCPPLALEARDVIRLADATVVVDRSGAEPEHVRLVGVRAEVVNPTPVRLTSGGDAPVSLSARLVGPDGSVIDHECERNTLVGGVAPGGRAPVAGLFRFARPDVATLRLTLVQDGVAWLDASAVDLPLPPR